MSRKRSPGGREVNGWGGRREPGEGKTLGRPKVGNPPTGRTVSAYLSNADADYLAKWGEGNTAALRELIRARARCRHGEQFRAYVHKPSEQHLLLFEFGAEPRHGVKQFTGETSRHAGDIAHVPAQ